MIEISKLLVANRGEIAIRIMKTAKKMGIQTVAVYSDADREALHVQKADEAYHIGPSPSASSYLMIEKIMEVAKKSGAQAIHPGYGFLSENSKFSKAIADAGLIFVGPNEKAIEVMGSKLAAKDAVKPMGVPLVPGVDHAVEEVDEALSIAESIGYPILIKASAGGGGKGMRIVNSKEELKEGMQRAISEAKSAFGDGSVFIEKFIVEPRHIEVQVLFDNHGNGVYVFDRECSIQRRHQKVVEEAPANDLPNDVRKAMGKTALNVGKSVDYCGAGTVEFLVDKDYNYYFLEMNTRLQVEHPVSEMISGVDLVEEQIRVARGERLRFSQEDLAMHGHSIELRIYAEDPSNQFLPSTGVLSRYRIPKGPGIRVDHGYQEGQEIPIYYDPMIAKLVVHGENRHEALKILGEAIEDYQIEGIETTLPFGKALLKHPVFRKGKYTTNFIKEYFNAEMLEETNLDPNVIGRVGQQLFDLASTQVRP